MKKIAFLSSSLLSHNLMRALMPLVDKTNKKMELVSFSDINEINFVFSDQKSCALIVVDWNVLSPIPNLLETLTLLKKKKNQWSKPRNKPWNQATGSPKPTSVGEQTPWILFYPRTAEQVEILKEKEIFDGYYQKPFLAEECVQILLKNL